MVITGGMELMICFQGCILFDGKVRKLLRFVEKMFSVIPNLNSAFVLVLTQFYFIVEFTKSPNEAEIPYIFVCISTFF